MTFQHLPFFVGLLCIALKIFQDLLTKHPSKDLPPNIVSSFRRAASNADSGAFRRHLRSTKKARQRAMRTHSQYACSSRHHRFGSRPFDSGPSHFQQRRVAVTRMITGEASYRGGGGHKSRSTESRAEKSSRRAPTRSTHKAISSHPTVPRRQPSPLQNETAEFEVWAAPDSFRRRREIAKKETGRRRIQVEGRGDSKRWRDERRRRGAEKAQGKWKTAAWGGARPEEEDRASRTRCRRREDVMRSGTKRPNSGVGETGGEVLGHRVVDDEQATDSRRVVVANTGVGEELPVGEASQQKEREGCDAIMPLSTVDLALLPSCTQSGSCSVPCSGALNAVLVSAHTHRIFCSGSEVGEGHRSSQCNPLLHERRDAVHPAGLVVPQRISWTWQRRRQTAQSYGPGADRTASVESVNTPTGIGRQGGEERFRKKYGGEQRKERRKEGARDAKKGDVAERTCAAERHDHRSLPATAWTSYSGKCTERGIDTHSTQEKACSLDTIPRMRREQRRDAGGWSPAAKRIRAELTETGSRQMYRPAKNQIIGKSRSSKFLAVKNTAPSLWWWKETSDGGTATIRSRDRAVNVSDRPYGLGWRSQDIQGLG
ncbi:hypothetical protein C8R45DRAFT_1076648 [Mycena sanguinolenta]|nr:hypothetical protein C8R45DRAFT_1076648 [Mycena sanguinolenta]